MYSVVFTRGDSLPCEKDFSLIADGLLTLAEAKFARKTNGDLVVYSATLEIVCDDLTWLDENDSYALRMITKQKHEADRLKAAQDLGINIVRQDLTHAQKVGLFANGKYSMPAPSVCSAHWNIDAWLSHIDNYGRWHVA